MSPRPVAGVLLPWLLLAAVAHAVETPDPQAPPPQASPPDAPRPDAAPPTAPAPQARPGPASLPFSEWKWEGAVGPVVSYSPDYSGASTRKVSWSPGYYLRYGRISLSNVGGFVTRRNQDDIFRGLGLDVKRDDRLRLNVALRIDNGRTSAETHGLAGIDDVRRTLRARFSATLQFAPGWKVATGLNADVLGRGGGNILDLGMNHDRRWSASTTWALGATVTAGDSRYMKTWYGVSESASAATGHPAYSPGAGLRDVALATTWRTEFGDRWIVLWNASVGRLVGPAAASPLTTSQTQWGASVGVAVRF